MIFPVFWSFDGKWAFQRVGEYWNLYGEDGSFEKEFRSFKSMCEYISKEEMK